MISSPSTNQSVDVSRLEDRARDLSSNDRGNALRLAHRHGRNLRYDHTSNRWLLWDGRRFAIDVKNQVQELAAETANSLFDELKWIENPTAQRAWLRCAQYANSERGIRAMLELAKSLPEIAVEANELDTHRMLLNCLNGTLDLRTGHLGPHNRSDLITKLAPVDFDPSSPCTRWITFLEDVFAKDESLIAYLQRLLGYGLTGLLDEHVLALFWGDGANGKSTLAATIMAVMGDYAGPAPPGLLLAKHFGDGHPCDVADLKGLRLVIDQEIDQGRRINEGKVKRLTGGDRLKARHLFQAFFDFVPTSKFILCLNHKPVIKGQDEGIWRRIHLVPFEVVIPVEKRDPKLGEKLWEERGAILAWAVQGCLKWQTDGLSPPERILEETRSFREEMDVVGQYLDARCVIDATQEVSAADLYADFQLWCESEGVQVPSKKSFGSELSKPIRGIIRGKEGKTGRIKYVGLRLRRPDDLDDMTGVSKTLPDDVGDFLRNSVLVHEDYEISALELFGDYRQWSLARKRTSVGWDAFVEALKFWEVSIVCEEDGDWWIRGLDLMRNVPRERWPTEGSEGSDIVPGTCDGKDKESSVDPSDPPTHTFYDLIA